MSETAGNEAFAGALRGLRTKARLTQEQLAERSALSVRTIRDLERGRIRSPRPESLRLLAEVLGVGGDELEEFEELGRREYWKKRAVTAEGIEPPSAPVRDASAPASRTPVPAQLPPDVTAFTGRAEHLRALDALLHDDHGTAMRIAVVVGAPGVGKTTLAVHWAHRVRHLFPDGQLHLNLAGHSESAPLSEEEALRRSLRALGVPPERIPPEPAEASALLRSVLSDTRTLLVLDDVGSAEQVRSLLPGSSGCFVLATSRTAQRALVARDGARQLTLFPFDPEESHALLSRVLGPEPVAAEPGAVVELAELCGHLPLALRIAAANLVGRPGRNPVAGYVHRLRDVDRLAALSVAPGPETTVRTAFDLSYAALPAQARHLFRLLPLAPGPDVTAAAAAALLGGAPDRVPALLEVLATAHLVQEVAPDRFVQPDLLRIYAVERSRQEDDDDGRRSAWERLLAHYLEGLDEAARTVYPDTPRLAKSSGSGSTRFPGPREALAWIDDELPALQAAVLTAARTGPAQATWLLADALRGYFQLRGTVGPWRAVAGAALAAAEAAGEPAAQAVSHLGLAGACARQDRFDEATGHGERALDLARAAGWTDGELAAQRALGNLCRLSGRPHQAIAHLQQALLLAEHEPGCGAVLEQIATAHHELGRLAEAASHYERALAVHGSSGSSARVAQIRTGLGDVLHWLGRSDEALRHLREALVVHRELDDRGLVAYNLRCQAELHRDLGRLERALEVAAEALDVARQDDDMRLQAQVRETLGTIHLAAGRDEEALADLEAALALAVATSNPYTQAQVFLGLSRVRRRSGHDALAVEHAAAALELARAGDYAFLEGQALTALARAELAVGRAPAAVERARAAIAVHEVTGCPAGRADAQRALDDAVTNLRGGA